MKKLNFLIMSDRGSDYKPNKLFINAIENRGHNWDILHPKDAYLLLSESVSGFDRLYTGDNDGVKRVFAKNIDIIIPRIANLRVGIPVLRHLNENLKIYSTQSADGLRIAADKWLCAQKMSSNGVKIPVQLFADKPQHIEWMFSKIGHLPAVAKQLSGSQGKAVTILETPMAANSTLTSMYYSDLQLLLQKFIDADSSDIRAIVAGDKIIAAMKRTGRNTFKANISAGGSGELVELSKEDQELCIKAAKACDLEVCGVDIIKNKNTGESYCIEQNGNFGLKIQALTGIDVCQGVVDYAIERYNETSKHKKNTDDNDAKGARPIFGDYVYNNQGMNFYGKAEQEIRELSNYLKSF